MMRNIRLHQFEGMTINQMCQRLNEDAMNNHTVVFVSETGIRIEYPSMELCKSWHGHKTIAEMRMYLFDFNADSASILVNGNWHELPQPEGEYTFYVEVRDTVFQMIFINPLLNLLLGPRPTAA